MNKKVKKPAIMPRRDRLAVPPPINPAKSANGRSVHHRMLNPTDGDRVDFMIWLEGLWGSETGDLLYMTLHNLRDNAIRRSREHDGESSDTKLGRIQAIDEVIEAMENYKHDGLAAKKRLTTRQEPDPDAQSGVEGGDES
jgi:hypothetical protein